MCATPSPSQLDRPLVEAEFGELICADEELLRAEFAAIVAAEWPAQPPGTGRPPGRSPDGPNARRQVGAAPAAAARRPPRDRRVATARVRRPRSPPDARTRSNF